MEQAKLDIPVALIFFNRPQTLKKVFEKVKEVRPSKLFLIQDGPRDGNHSDYKEIMECRIIVENQIDWECTVYKNYSDVNMGCGMRPHTGISWVFEHVDKAIFLEDDCVPNSSFFLFCKEMLKKYQNDLRIGMVTGINYFNEFDFGGYSYGFVKTGGIWGWATWKDRWAKYDYYLRALDDKYIRQNLKLDITPQFAAKKRVKTWLNAKEEIEKKGVVSYWDYQWGLIRHVNSWLTIVPKFSLISNIGIGRDSTHSGSDMRVLPKKIASFFFMGLKELEFPLEHPEFVLADRLYDEKYYKIIYPNYFLKLTTRGVKELYYRVIEILH